jgi:hypothetical protein
LDRHRGVVTAKTAAPTISAAAVVVAVVAAVARSRIVVCYHILPRTRVQRLMAGSLEAVSAECCLGEGCSHVVWIEAEYTAGTPRTWWVPAVRREHELAESRIAPDAPSHNRTQVASVNGLGPVRDRAGEAKRPHIAWPVRAMTKRRAYVARQNRADVLSQEWGSYTAVAVAAAVAEGASKTFLCLEGISTMLR